MLEQLGNEQGPRLLLPSGFTHFSLWLPLLSPSRRMSSSHHATFPTATKQEDRRQGKGEALSLWTCVIHPCRLFPIGQNLVTGHSELQGVLGNVIILGFP